MKIKVLTWNIYNGKYINRIIGFLKSEKPHVLGLQEINKIMSKYIAKKIGYNLSYYPAFKTGNAEQGNAILSKFPIISSKRHLLGPRVLYKGTGETEPRIAIEAQINYKQKNFTFVTTHLAISRHFIPTKIKTVQFKKLLKIIKKRKFILAGDFNSLPKSTIIKTLSSRLINTGGKRQKNTWTIYKFKRNDWKENNLKYCLDYIFASQDLKVVNFRIGHTTTASDHLPVIAELKFVAK